MEKKKKLNSSAVSKKTKTSSPKSKLVNQKPKATCSKSKASSQRPKIKQTKSMAITKDNDKIKDLAKSKNEKDPSKKTLYFMYDFAQAIAIASLLVLLTISFVVVGQVKKTELSQDNVSDVYFKSLDSFKVVKKDKKSFGALIFGQDNSQREELACGESADGNLATTTESYHDLSIDNLMFLGQAYEYIYTGDDFELLPKEVDVYKRVSPDFSSDFNTSLLNKKISFLNFSRFKNPSIQDLSINEERDYGYSIFLNLKNGYFSFFKNWNKWPSSNNNYQFSANNVLSDAELNNIANDFLQKYDINLSSYDPAEPQKYWLSEYNASANKDSYYISEIINLIYPLKINGLTVYNDSGQKEGVNIDIDMLEKKVVSFYNMNHQHYESALYDTESDKETILKMALQGGIYPEYYYGDDFSNNKNRTMELGTPVLGFLKTWQHDSENIGNNSELYVPAYIFPVKNKLDNNYFFRSNIVVPAVKDFFSIDNNILRGVSSPSQGNVVSLPLSQ